MLLGLKRNGTLTFCTFKPSHVTVWGHFWEKFSYPYFFLINGRSFSAFPDSRAGEGAPQKIDHAVIGGVVAVVMFAILCALIVLGRYFARHKGKTPEVQSHSIMTWSVVLFRVDCSGTEVCGRIKGRRAANLSPLHCCCSRHLLHAWGQRRGRRGRRRHGHHQRGGRTQQHRREERVLYLKRPGQERRVGMLKVVVLEESFFKPPIGHKKAWGRDFYRKTAKSRTGAAKRRCRVSYPSLPGLLGPILYSLINLQTILCLVRFCLFCCSPFFPPFTPSDLLFLASGGDVGLVFACVCCF